MTTAEPKPCPYCGARLIRNDDEHFIKQWRHHDGDCREACAVIDDADMEAWNRRASPWRPIGEATESDLPFYGHHTSKVRGLYGSTFPVVAVCRKPQHDGPGRRAWADEQGHIYFFTHFAELPSPPAEGEKEGWQ